MESSQKQYLLKLLPPRPTFMQNMTAEERAIMGQHVAYWKNLHKQGYVIALGPVMDPNGGWGLGIIEAENEDQLKGFMDNDPAVLGGVGRYEWMPMRVGMVRGER